MQQARSKHDSRLQGAWEPWHSLDEIEPILENRCLASGEDALCHHLTDTCPHAKFHAAAGVDVELLPYIAHTYTPHAWSVSQQFVLSLGSKCTIVGKAKLASLHCFATDPS